MDERVERLVRKYTTERCTLEDLGQEEGVTRERVRQLLWKAGITSNQSYRRSVSGSVRKETERRLKREKHCQAIYGCSWEEVKRLTGREVFTNLRSHPLVKAYFHHRGVAKRNIIPWEIALPEYAEILSPILDRFGLGRKQLVLRRKDPLGPFSKGNLEVMTLAESSFKTGGFDKGRKVMCLRKMRAAEERVFKTVEMLNAGHTQKEIAAAVGRCLGSVACYVKRAKILGLLK